LSLRPAGSATSASVAAGVICSVSLMVVMMVVRPGALAAAEG
jgi:hypothetical protein